MEGSAAPTKTHRLNAVMREGETVTPLELFFDLVFVLALTQCTALMAEQPTWEGLAKGLLVLGVMWWAWVGYAWLTSVVDPEEGAVRISIFAAMAALLIVSLCVPQAFDGLALEFALAYGVVRAGQIAPVLDRQPRRARVAQLGHGARGRDVLRASGSWSRRPSSTGSPRARSGCSSSSSTSAGRT